MSNEIFDVQAALKDHPEADVAGHVAKLHGIDRNAYLEGGLTDTEFLSEYGGKTLPPPPKATTSSANDPLTGAITGAVVGSTAEVANRGIDISKALDKFSKGMNAAEAPPAPTPEPELTPGEKYKSKTGYGAGAGESVKEVSDEWKRIEAEKTKPIGRGKVSSRVIGGSPEEILARAKQEELELAEQARLRAQQKLAKEAAEAAKQKALAAEQKALAAEAKYAIPNKVGKTLPVAGATLGYNAMDVVNQAKEGDAGQTIVAGAGTAGSIAPFLKKLPPKLRAIGVGASLLAPAINRTVDAFEEKAQGGLVGLAAGGKLGKAAELAAKFVPKPTKILKASEALGAHEGKKLGLTQTDNFGVHDGRMGGNRFPDFQNTSPIHQRDQVVWMNDSEKHARDMVNRGGEDTIWSTYIGAPDQLKSNKSVFNDILQQHYKRDLTPEQIELINQRIATVKPSKNKPLIFPQAFDIRDKFAAQELGGDTFARRAAMADILGAGEGVGKIRGGIALPEYQDILRSHRDPLTEGVPTSSVGTRLFTVDPHTPTQFSQQYHPDYNWTVHGKDTGVQFEQPVPQQLAVPDWYNEINARAPGKTHGNAWFSYMKDPQKITEEMLTRMQKEGYADGGSVMPDVSMDVRSIPSMNGMPGVGYMQTPQGSMARLQMEKELEKARLRAGVSGMAMAIPGQHGVKTMPGQMDIGANIPLGRGNLDISANRSINPIPGRGHMQGVNARYTLPFKKGGLA